LRRNKLGEKAEDVEEGEEREGGGRRGEGKEGRKKLNLRRNRSRKRVEEAEKG